MKTRSSLALLVSTCALALFAGCSSLKTVNVQADASLAGASVVVDVIAETDKNVAIETVPVREYWRSGALRQPALTSTLRFGAGQNATQAVTKNWSALGAKKVVVIADLPGVFQDLPGEADARRRIIPVGKASTVTVRLAPSGLIVESH